MEQWIDIGANLADASFAHDRDAVIDHAVAAGVTQIVITGSSLESNDVAANLAANDARLAFTAGVHPHHAGDYDADAHARLREQLARPGISAAGECGLDYFRDIAPRDAQAHAFIAQLELAAEAGLPVFLHQRDAHDDFMAILKPRLKDLPPVVTHCFTAGERELDDYLELGCYVGITGWICDERRGLHLRELVRRIPSDKLMLETDAPYLMPRTLRPKPKTRRNEPQWLPEVAKVVAESRGESLRELAALTTANAKRFFGLP